MRMEALSTHRTARQICTFACHIAGRSGVSSQIGGDDLLSLRQFKGIPIATAAQALAMISALAVSVAGR
jgi:hypothetical protein